MRWRTSSLAAREIDGVDFKTGKPRRCRSTHPGAGCSWATTKPELRAEAPCAARCLIDDHDPRLRVHFGECMSGAQPGDTGTDQSANRLFVCPSEQSRAGELARLRNPATYIGPCITSSACRSTASIRTCTSSRESHFRLRRSLARARIYKACSDTTNVIKSSAVQKTHG